MSKRTIPEEVIAEVLKRNDIIEVIGKYVHLTKQGKNFKGLCPFHSEKTPSFTVSPDKQIFNCFGCGKAGHVIKFIMEIENASFPEAVKILAEENGLKTDFLQMSSEETEEQKRRSHMIQGHEFAAKLYHYILIHTEQGNPALSYLRNRGFSDRAVEQFGIGYAPQRWDTLAQLLGQRNYQTGLMEKAGLILSRQEAEGYYDRFRDRVMFPIHDGQGRAVGFGGRILGEGQPKYLNTPETPLFNKSRLLYNLHRAKGEIRKSGEAVLFEGYADVIKAWEAGVENGVATMGTAMTEEHARLLARFAERVVICYDGDNAGQAAAFKTLPLLEKQGLESRVAIIPDRMDPDEYIAAKGAQSFILDILGDAVPATKFKLIYLQRDHILQEDEGKLKYIRSALKVVAELTSPTEREYYLKQLSQDYGFTLDTLQYELHLVREDMQKKRNYGDNKDKPWNTGMNDRKAGSPSRPLLPAYHNAERSLLLAMMDSKQITEYVQEQLGDLFNVEDHAALAAYLYAYYAAGSDPDARAFIAGLQDERLEALAGSILLAESGGKPPPVIDDYIRVVRNHAQLKELEQKRQDVKKAEKAKDFLRAAQIANEVLEMERRLR